MSMADKAYVAQHVSGFEALAGALDDPAWQLDEVAAAAASPAAICSVSTSSLPVPQDRHPVLPGDQPVQPGGGQGQRHHQRPPAVRAHRQAGAAPFSMTGQPNAMGGREVGGLDPARRPHGLWRGRVRSGAALLGSPTMVRGPGHKAVELFEAVHRGRRALWVLGTNPAVSCRTATGCARPEPLRAAGGLRGDGQHRHGAPRPPAAARRRLGEKSGTVTNSERTISRQRAFLPLPGRPGPTGGP
jgi:assimilatory nitrate reductase catalytic subunit